MASGVRDALECKLEGQWLLVSSNDLQQVIEYTVSAPLPLSEPWVSGLGVERERVFVSLNPSPKRDAHDGRRVKGVLMRGGDGVPWALEVEAVRAVVRADVQDELRPTAGFPAAWCKKALLGDGDERTFIDADEVNAHLTRAAR
jgi:hypothetical protein